jgi:twitching motility protein PilT
MIEIGQKFGMNTMNMCLCELVKNRKVDRFEALSRSPSPDQLEQLFVKEGV